MKLAIALFLTISATSALANDVKVGDKGIVASSRSFESATRVRTTAVWQNPEDVWDGSKRPTYVEKKDCRMPANSIIEVVETGEKILIKPTRSLKDPATCGNADGIYVTTDEFKDMAEALRLKNLVREGSKKK